MSSTPGPLGQRIATELRAELGRQNKSRRWLAEQIGAPHNTVSRWINGETCPPLDSLDHMCDALGLSVIQVIAASKARLERGSETLTRDLAAWGRRATDFRSVVAA